MPNSTKAPVLVADILSDLGHPAMWWQIGALALSLLFAWGVNQAIRQRLPATSGALKLGIGGVTRVVFPLTALGGVLIGEAIVRGVYDDHVHLLKLAIPLLFALALIRLTVYALRHTFAPSGWLSTSERFISTVVWLGVALHLTGFLPEILAAADEASFHIGRQKVSILTVLTGLLSVAVTMVVAMWLGRSVETRVMRAEKLDVNLRVVLSKLIRAALLVVGVLIALPAAGIDITVLSVFSGALGVGIGFGLQKIASNYVSGFIILLDRSIHLGDTLTVDNRFGVVSQLTARYLVLKSADGTESIIPNDTLITSTVINHTYTNREIRVAIPVQVSYQTDLTRAMQIILEVAERHPRVLAEPEPKTYLRGFGDNGIDLELGVWINDPEEGQGNLRSEINLSLWEEFQAAGVEIPYPQRDVRIIQGPPPTV
jgi:small-conductance mechanosensitive channel